LVVVPLIAFCGCATGITGSPDSVSHNGAQLTGTVVSNAGGGVEYWVQYGPTKAYGSETAHATVSAQQNVGAAVEVGVSGLARSTTYHYRLCAQDSQQQGGPGCGDDATFKTQSFACGETVTAAVRLTADVHCPDRFTPGIVIGADGVDVNLAGHELRSDGTPTSGGASAVENNGFDDLIVRDGRIEGWAESVGALEAERNRILRVTAGAPIVIFEGGDHEIRHSEVSGRIPVNIDDSDRVVVADSTVHSSYGAAIKLGGNEDRAVRNTVDGDSAGTNSAAIEVFGPDATVLDNQLTWLKGNGIQVFEAVERALVRGNVVTGVTANSGGVGDPSLTGNGIEIQGPNAIVRDNTANGNATDGIDVREDGARLRDNTANDNGGFGIDAPTTVIDGGGNKASGNGNPLQCRNVFCQ
jgi:hypothetical protein